MADKDELIKELSDKYHVDEQEVRKAVEFQFKFLADKMASDEFPEVRLPYFGIFKAHEKRIKHLNKNKDNNE